MTEVEPTPLAGVENDEHRHESGATCILCATQHSFVLPPAIVEAAIGGRLVVFAGAGISTETKAVFPHTFYDEMKSWLSSPLEDDSFPAVMAAAEAEVGRVRLIEEAIDRIRYASTFPYIYKMATRFHRELATIPQISEVITTNWDPFFEDICGMIPIVVDGDYSFYNLPGRKVYKIHGSTSIVSTIIATSADYARRESELRESVIGGTLRHLLGTKVVLFTGYSLRDDDFRNVYEPLMGGMGQLRPVAYVISPFEVPEAEELGLRHIKTDGAYFMHELKASLVAGGHNLPDSVFRRMHALRDEVINCHLLTEQMNWREHPQILFSLAYQDGFLDSLGRMLSQAHTGEYSSVQKVARIIHSYSHMLPAALEKKRYWDAAYIDGYRYALHLLLCDDEDMSEILAYELFDEEDFPTTAEGEDAGIASTDSVSVPDDQGVDSEGEIDAIQEDAKLEASDSNTSGEARTRKMLRLLDEEELVAGLGNVNECLPDMVSEARGMIEKVREHVIPQHPPFLYGINDPVPVPRI